MYNIQNSNDWARYRHYLRLKGHDASLSGDAFKKVWLLFEVLLLLLLINWSFQGAEKGSDMKMRYLAKFFPLRRYVLTHIHSRRRIIPTTHKQTDTPAQLPPPLKAAAAVERRREDKRKNHKRASCITSVSRRFISAENCVSKCDLEGQN